MASKPIPSKTKDDFKRDFKPPLEFNHSTLVIALLDRRQDRQLLVVTRRDVTAVEAVAARAVVGAAAALLARQEDAAGVVADGVDGLVRVVDEVVEWVELILS